MNNKELEELKVLFKERHTQPFVDGVLYYKVLFHKQNIWFEEKNKFPFDQYVYYFTDKHMAFNFGELYAKFISLNWVLKEEEFIYGTIEELKKTQENTSFYRFGVKIGRETKM